MRPHVGPQLGVHADRVAVGAAGNGAGVLRRATAQPAGLVERAPRARSGDSWSAPAFLTLTGGSFGLQIGVQRSNIVLVIMVPEGLDDLFGTRRIVFEDAVGDREPLGLRRQTLARYAN